MMVLWVLAAIVAIGGFSIQVRLWAMSRWQTRVDGEGEMRLRSGVVFRVQPAEGFCADFCSIEELEAGIAEFKGHVVRVVDLQSGREEVVEVMEDGSTWYPWASRHRVDLRSSLVG